MGTKKLEESVSNAQNVGTRSLLAFWIMGVCQNIGFVVILTAGHDILSGGRPESHTDNPRDCNTVSTGAILLANQVPAVLVKFIAPFLPYNEHFRMTLTYVTAAAAFCIVGYAAETNTIGLVYFGVALVSFESGLHETTLTCFMSFYRDKNVITAWGSGTGAGGFIAAFYYAAMTGIGLTPTTTIYTLVSVPILEALVFWVLLNRPNLGAPSSTPASPQNSIRSEKHQESERKKSASSYTVPTSYSTLKFSDHISILPKLVKYMAPIFLVYYFEYLINQGLFELLYFRNIWLNHHEQYRWYQVLYQIGVLISRSSLSFVKFNQMWVFTALQFGNLVYLYFDSMYSISPTINLVFTFILFEGLLGGAAYTNTLYKIDTEVPISERQFSMSMTVVSDSIGIALAGLSAIPLHNYICGVPLRIKS